MQTTSKNKPKCNCPTPFYNLQKLEWNYFLLTKSPIANMYQYDGRMGKGSKIYKNDQKNSQEFKSLVSPTQN